jgi:hypothetical protein
MGGRDGWQLGILWGFGRKDDIPSSWNDAKNINWGRVSNGQKQGSDYSRITRVFLSSLDDLLWVGMLLSALFWRQEDNT